jgi:hypothetical protein
MGLIEEARDDGRLVRTWTHEGIECAMVRSPMIGVNGYVRVPEGVELPQDEYGDIMLEVHWGITYADGDGWIGFDTGHAYDVWLDPDVPEDHYSKTMREVGLSNPHTEMSTMFPDMTVIWTLEKLEAEVNNLAVQVHARKLT